MAQIFISHSQADKPIKALFERVFAATKVKAVFVEYESYQPPASAFIQEQINSANAVFLLLGPNVEKLSHTKVWIGSEAGIAQQARRDIWVFEPFPPEPNIPVPFISHYVPYVNGDLAFPYIKAIVNSYDDSAALSALIRGAGIGGTGAAILSETKKGEAAFWGALFGAAFESWRTDPARLRPVGLPIRCGH